MEIPKNLKVTSEYLEIPMATILDSHTHPFPGKYNVNLPESENEGY
jgi:hypothetical protein